MSTTTAMFVMIIMVSVMIMIIMMMILDKIDEKILFAVQQTTYSAPRECQVGKCGG